MMESFDYKYQNPLRFLYIMLIGTIVIYIPVWFKNLNKKGETKWILVVVVKWRHCAIVLFTH